MNRYKDTKLYFATVTNASLVVIRTSKNNTYISTEEGKR